MEMSSNNIPSDDRPLHKGESNAVGKPLETSNSSLTPVPGEPTKSPLPVLSAAPSFVPTRVPSPLPGSKKYENAIEDDAIDDNAISYPPMGIGRKVSKINRKIMNQIEWICSVVGGVMFVWGSYLFLPTLGPSTKAAAAIMFITGSTLFEVASIALYYRLDANLWKDFGMSCNCCLYIFANFLFIIGSVFFYPNLPYPCELTGIWIFIIGSLIFLVAPLYDIYRAYCFYLAQKEETHVMRETLSALSKSGELSRPALSSLDLSMTDLTPAEENTAATNNNNYNNNLGALGSHLRLSLIESAEQINFVTYLAQISVCSFYILGSLLFLVGSVMFLPQYFSRDSYEAVMIFIIGSVLFFLATLTTTFASSILAVIRYYKGESKPKADDAVDRNRTFSV